jgi:hypothetical protein
MVLGTVNHAGIFNTFDVPRSHTLIIGRGRGKSTLIKNLALDDIHNNLPVVYFGDDILDYIPKERRTSTVLVEPHVQPFPFNPLAKVPTDRHALVASVILDALKSAWHYENASTPNIDLYVRASIQTLLHVPGTSLLSLKYILTSQSYRTYILGNVLDPFLKDFWNDFEQIKDKDRRQEIASTLNKVWSFLLDPYIRNVLDQEKNRMSLKDTVVLLSFRKEQLGYNAQLLGTLAIAHIYLEGLLGLRQTVYIDDARRFGTALLVALMECPNITVVLSLKYLDQLQPDLIKPIVGSVQQFVAFRTSIEDEHTLHREFNIPNMAEQLHQIEDFTAYHSIDGTQTLVRMDGFGYTPQGSAEKIRAKHRNINQKDLETRQRRFFME